MDSALIEPLLAMGLPGIVILALGWFALKKDQQLQECNEKRIAENRETIKAIEQNTNTLETLAEVLKAQQVHK